MKNIYLIIILSVLSITLSGQKLIDEYKKGIVNLIPDTDYGKDNNWNTIFKSYNDSLNDKNKGAGKSFIIMPDGAVVVNNYNRDFYTKFLPNGKFEKEFGIINSKGVQLKKINSISGIINNNIFFTGLNNMGIMNCFDFNGKFIKTLKLNYMTNQMISLPNNKFAVVGWVIWEKKFRDFVAIVDYITNIEKIVWDHYTDRNDAQNGRQLFSYQYMFKKHGGISYTSMPYTNTYGMSSRPQIACVDNKLIIALSSSREILIYDLDGNLKLKQNIEWPLNYISVQEQKEIQKKAIDNLKNPSFRISNVFPEEHKLANEFIKNEMEADLLKIKDPIPLPVFSTIIRDSDGNLLFFEQAKEENGNKFNVWVFAQKGSFVCQCSFVCDDYELEINPSKMAFYNGYIYGLQRLKNAKGEPLRLVRFKLK